MIYETFFVNIYARYTVLKIIWFYGPSQQCVFLDLWQTDSLSIVNPVLNAATMASDDGAGGYPGSLAASLSGTVPGSPARHLSQLREIRQLQDSASQQPAFPALPAALSSELQGKLKL